MKKWIGLGLLLVCVLSLAGCGKGEKHTIELQIPAGSAENFVYSEEEISPQSGKLTISAGAGITRAQVTLKTTDGQQEIMLEPVELKQRDPVKFDVEKGTWYQVCISAQNPSDTGMAVAVQVENVIVRIE